MVVEPICSTPTVSAGGLPPVAWPKPQEVHPGLTGLDFGGAYRGPEIHIPGGIPYRPGRRPTRRARPVRPPTRPAREPRKTTQPQLRPSPTKAARPKRWVPRGQSRRATRPFPLRARRRAQVRRSPAQRIFTPQIGGTPPLHFGLAQPNPPKSRGAPPEGAAGPGYVRRQWQRFDVFHQGRRL